LPYFDLNFCIISLTLLSSVIETHSDQDAGEQSLWIVRAGQFGEQEKKAIESCVVTIGWYELPDLSTIVDKNELDVIWKEVYPNQNKNEAAMQSSIVFNFLKGIKIGDLAAIPLKSEPA